MKRLLFLALLLTTFTAQEAFAQDQPTEAREGRTRGEGKGDPAARIAAQVEELTEGLKLTPEQATQVTAILTETQEKMNALRAETGSDRAGMRQKMRPLREESDKQIEALLTKKQLKKYANLKAARRQGGPRGGGRPGGGGGRSGGDN